jgi:hypothetical protein
MIGAAIFFVIMAAVTALVALVFHTQHTGEVIPA